MYKRGILAFEYIKSFLNDPNSFLLSYIFLKEIKDFDSFINSKDKPDDLDESFFENENDHLSFVECLVNQQVGINAKNKSRETPLRLNSSRGEEENKLEGD